ncbi:MAG: carboxypeptidase regulatory-like domain-containing protein, partial [Pyrinomonadaceae bacterium]|nr:carboxypeptidase regulatory-like domain-containing protein [Pyrinomonadaceae bacterium]
MFLFSEVSKRIFNLALVLALCAGVGLSQQTSGALRGVVKDEFGGVIVGASVVAMDASGEEKTVTTNDEGVYVLAGLVPGVYTVRAQASGFAPYENAETEVITGRATPVDITLGVTIAAEEVMVAAEGLVSTEPENNAGAIVLREQDIEA